MTCNWKWAAAWMGLLVWTAACPAQDLVVPNSGVTGMPDLNIKLRLLLDRSNIKVYEPLYVCATADRFAAKVDPDIQVMFKDEKPLDLGRMGDQWLKSDLTQSPMRLCILLADTSIEGDERFLFSKPGLYTIRVKIGPDATPLQIKVDNGPASDVQAFTELGAANFKALLTEDFTADPSRDLIKVCQTVVHTYPDSTAANYCRAYLAIDTFKESFRVHKAGGGTSVWEPVAFQLGKCFVAHRDSFYGEEVGFYLAYAQGLSKDFAAMAQTINSVKTHVTPWADRMEGMKKEVSQHVKPKVVVLPTQPSR